MADESERVRSGLREHASSICGDASVAWAEVRVALPDDAYQFGAQSRRIAAACSASIGRSAIYAYLNT
jgi:hypothetical protein